MSNVQKENNTVPLERWINNRNIRRGILSVYANEPFNYDDDSRGYEIGRQIAICAKAMGFKTRGTILRKKPNSEQMAIVKTKLKALTWIIYYDLGFSTGQLSVDS
jgi:hypothetical protein